VPASIRIAAGFFERETFALWNPQTGVFGPATVTGRNKRIDAFVSLWHRSSRRHHIYLLPESSTANIYALRSLSNDTTYIVSQTTEADSWQGDDNIYSRMLRCHKVSAPSGGSALHYPVRVLGSGDDLGPVVMQPTVNGLADTELRSTSDDRESVQIAIGEFLLAFSRNLVVNDGDFLVVNGTWYRVIEVLLDSGYHYARAIQDEPRFQTVEFKLPSATPATFDPRRGRLTGGTEMTRQVSVLVDTTVRSGQLAEHVIAEKLTVYIYRNHIGFRPELGHGLVLNGVRYTVDAVSLPLEQKQWKLEVSR
jgi:hypothetical protein